MDQNKTELFVIRVLAGFEPMTGEPLTTNSPWKNADIQTAFRSLANSSGDPDAANENDDDDCDCVFPF